MPAEHGLAYPVITIDGPSGAGKGTLAQNLANALGWHLLDSGAIYRVLGLALQRSAIDTEDLLAVTALAKRLPVRFVPLVTGGVSVMLDHEDVSKIIRTDDCGQWASKVASIAEVREALLQRQKDFCQAPGLVADGRDMGTVVFPNADFKLFLDASPECRAQRRLAELQARGEDVSLRALIESIRERDARDRNRPIAPLRPAADALLLDSTGLSVKQVFDEVYSQIHKRGLV